MCNTRLQEPGGDKQKRSDTAGTSVFIDSIYGGRFNFNRYPLGIKDIIILTTNNDNDNDMSHSYRI